MKQRSNWILPPLVVVLLLCASGLACGRGDTPEPTVWVGTATPAQAPTQPPAAQPTAGQPAAPEPTAEPPPTETEPVEPPPELGLPVIDYFYAEGSANAGCFYLHWDLHDATAAYLNGEGVVAPGSQEVCPEASATYTLRAENAVGSVEESLTVEKGEPPAPPPQPVGQADLVIIDAHLDPVPAVQGQPFFAVFAVENQGDAPAGPFTVFWQFHAVTGLKNCCTWEYNEQLGPGAQVGGIFRDLITNSQPGSSPTWVEVDYGDRVSEGEAGEANNRVSFDLVVVEAEASVPAVPANLRQAAIAPVGQLVLEWDHDSVDVERFQVRHVGVGWAAETGPGETSVSLDGPPCGEIWRFRVLACNAVGCSEPSNTLEVDGGSCQ
jgi:hypothetical protein